MKGGTRREGIEGRKASVKRLKLFSENMKPIDAFQCISSNVLHWTFEAHSSTVMAPINSVQQIGHQSVPCISDLR